MLGGVIKATESSGIVLHAALPVGNLRHNSNVRLLTMEPCIQSVATSSKFATGPTPSPFKFAKELFHRTENVLPKRNNRMLEDERTRLLQTTRIAVRRVFFRTTQTMSFVPRKLQATRLAAQQVVTRAIRKAKLQVSDDYVHGALDLLTVTALVSISTYALRLATRRYPTAADIPIRLIRRQRCLHGSVVAVRDGDNLRIRHTPVLHRLFGWYMKPRGRGIAADTINVRLAAVDAPECGRFGARGQRYGPDARDWLKRFVGRRVVVRLHATDQYRRVVGTVWAKSDIPVLGSLGLCSRNVGLELVKAGYATVYAGSGAVYGGIRHVYEKAEAIARGRSIGMWAAPVVETPGEYKRALRKGLLAKGRKIQGDTKVAQTDKTGPKALLKALVGMYEYLTKLR